MKKYYFLSILFLLSALNGKAYHIAGGDFTSKWVGGNNFEITLTLFRDCSNPQAAPYDQQIIIGIFDKQTDLLADTFSMTLGPVTNLQLTGTTCISPPAVCMQSGVYSKTITLPDNPHGYYLIWERCCRNSSVINITVPDRSGIAFYLEVPDPALHNSSPVIQSPPAPFACAGALFRISFQSIDVDGDSLAYEFTNPLSGGHTNFQQPNPYSIGGSGNGQIPLSAPYAQTTWIQGISLNNILGSTQPLVIDPQTGIAEGIPDAIGLYAMAVTIYEYRNGILIGTVRREIEFTVLACTGNQPPVASQNVNNANYEINASDTLCFDVKSNDPNGDSITVTYYGEVFNGPGSSINAPYATSNDTAVLDSSSVIFCWKTGCDQYRDSVYHVTYEFTDNGCPLPLVTKGNFTIKVNRTPSMPVVRMLCINYADSNTIQIKLKPDTVINTTYFSRFVIYRSDSSGKFSPYKTETNATLELFIDSNVRNKNYCYTISAINRCEEEIFSTDTLCTSDAYNKNQNYIVTATVEHTNEIKLMWDSFPNYSTVEYHIFRKENNPDSLWKEIYNPSGTTSLEWIDNKVLTDYRSYCYKMNNINACKQSSEISNTACTILLSGKSGYFENDLSWNSYLEWKGQVDSYHIEKAIANIFDSLEIFKLLSASDTTVNDTTLRPDGGVYRYRVFANEGNGGKGLSYSNEIELIQPPYAFVPSAFTPNGDNKNENWGVYTSFVKEMELNLFNRWGQLIYTAKSVNDRWDGTYNNRPVEQGVYYYKLRYKGFGVYQEFQRTGYVVLLY